MHLSYKYVCESGMRVYFTKKMLRFSIADERQNFSFSIENSTNDLRLKFVD